MKNEKHLNMLSHYYNYDFSEFMKSEKTNKEKKLLQMVYVFWMAFYIMYLIALISHLCMKEDLSSDNAGILVFISNITLFFSIGVFGFPEILVI